MAQGVDLSLMQNNYSLIMSNDEEAFLDSRVVNEMQVARLSGDAAKMQILLKTRNLPPWTDPLREMHSTLNTAIAWFPETKTAEKIRDSFKYFEDDPAIPPLTIEQLSRPLMYAIKHENRDIVNLLLRNGARVTKETEDSLYLKRQYDVKAFRLILDDLLKSGWDIDQGSLLWYAAASGHEFLVKWLLEHWANPHSTCGRNQSPPAMYYIARRCSPATLQLCFDNGYPVHSSAFTAAARRKPDKDRIPIFEMLFKYGGDVNCVEEVGVRRLSSSALRASAARAPRESALYAAVKAEDVELVQWLMERGADPLVRSYRGTRPAGTPAGIMRSSTNLVLREIGKKYCD